MKLPGRHSWWLLIIALALIVALALMLGPAGAAGPSTLSRGRVGWLGMAAWLESRGTPVVRHDLRLDQNPDLDGSRVLVAAFPAVGAYMPRELDAVQSFVHRGGTLIFAASSAPPGFAELQLADAFGLSLAPVGDDPPLVPWTWLRWARQPVELVAAEGWTGRPIRLPRPRWRTESGSESVILFRWRDGESAVWELSADNGRIIVLPAAVFSNPFLDSPGNADLLESLRISLDGGWSFDERRHGLVNPSDSESASRWRSFDMLLAQLVLLYLLAVFALARRFGPPWPETVTAAGSTAGFLRSIARLHRRLGHHAAAGRLLIERSHQLDPSVEVADLSRRPMSDADLLDLARRLDRNPQNKETP